MQTQVTRRSTGASTGATHLVPGRPQVPHTRSYRAALVVSALVLVVGCRRCGGEPEVVDAGPPPTAVAPAAAGGALCWQSRDAGLSAPEGAVDFLDLSLAASGPQTWLAWADRGVVIRRWEGEGPWTALPNPEGAGFGAARPALALDAEGRLLLAWEEDQDSGSGIRVARFADGAWQALGGSLGAYAAQGTPASDPVLLGGGAAPVIAWTELEPGVGRPSDDDGDTGDDARPEPVPGLAPAERPGQALWAAWWNGTRWSTGKAALARGSDLVSLEASAARDAEGTPWITWVGGTEATETFVRVVRLVDGAWQDVGGTVGAFLRGSGDIHSPRLAPLGDGMLLVWREGSGSRARLQAARWAAGRWERVQAPVMPAVEATLTYGPLLAAGGSDEAWAAWAESVPGKASTVTLASWKDGAWTRRLSGLTLEATPAGVRAVTLVRVDAGQVALAWDEPGGSGTRVHVITAAPCAPGASSPPLPAPATLTDDAGGDAEDAEPGDGPG